MSERAPGQEIAVHIDELVIDGGRGFDRKRVAAAVERELGQLVAGRPMRPEPAIHARIDAGTLAAGTAGDAGAVGRRVAEAVHRSLGGER